MISHLYNEYVEIDPKLKNRLKECIRTHYLATNQAAKILINNPNLTLDEYIKEAYAITQERNGILIRSVLQNDLKHCYKKHLKILEYRRNTKHRYSYAYLDNATTVTKRPTKPSAIRRFLSDIHYLTFSAIGTTSRQLVIDRELSWITIIGFVGRVLLPKPLPPMSNDTLYLLTLSFSNIEDRFKLQVCAPSLTHQT